MIIFGTFEIAERELSSNRSLSLNVCNIVDSIKGNQGQVVVITSWQSFFELKAFINWNIPD